jgi:hypothetical protein
MAALFAIGLALRWLFADGDFIGDDAWYLYLSHGFGTEPGVQAEHPWFHIANRPLFYVFYHLSTYGGLAMFRLLGCVVGACVPVLSYATARKLGASIGSAALMAAFLCVQRQQLEYSAAVFPDVLAAAFALGACWATASQRVVLAMGLAIASVLSKESFIFVPVIVVLLRALERGTWRLDRWDWAVLIVPALYLAVVTAVTLTTPDVRMQGWSTTGLTLKHARNMWLGPELWPLIGWLAWRRQTRILILWLGLPVFYLLWNRVLGRGIAPWYVVGPSALAAVAAALALDVVAAASRTRGRLLQTLAIGLTVACVFVPPMYGLMRVRAQLVKLDGHFPEPRAAPEVRALLARLQPPQLLLIDCFWAYRYSHLRGRTPATAAWWSGSQDTERVLDEARDAPMIVVCRQPAHQPIVETLQHEPYATKLFEDKDWLVLARSPEWYNLHPRH